MSFLNTTVPWNWYKVNKKSDNIKIKPHFNSMNLARDYGEIRTEKQLWGCSLAQTLGRAIDIISSQFASIWETAIYKKDSNFIVAVQFGESAGGWSAVRSTS